MTGERSLHLSQLREQEFLRGSHNSFPSLTAFSINLIENFVEKRIEGFTVTLFFKETVT